jgi:hypothetical protein
LVAETIGGVVVDQSDCLHEGVADGGSDKFEASLFQVPAHGLGFWSLSRHFCQILPVILYRLSVGELPDVSGKTAEF